MAVLRLRFIMVVVIVHLKCFALIGDWISKAQHVTRLSISCPVPQVNVN